MKYIHPRIVAGVLLHVAHADAFFKRNHTLCRLQLSVEHAEQRRFSDAVRTDEAHLVVELHIERNIREQRALNKGYAESAH